MSPVAATFWTGGRCGWRALARVVPVAGMLLPAPAAATEGPLPDLWIHRGSDVVAVWTGNAVRFRYLHPADNLHAAGVRREHLLFAGRMERRTARIRGTARLTRAGCPDGVSYAVSGRMVRGREGLHRIWLHGPAPTAVSGCRATALARTPSSNLLFLEWTE